MLPFLSSAPIEQSQQDSGQLEEEYTPGTLMPQFAILSDFGYQIGPWIQCKDYVQDAVWGAMFGFDVSVYGFRWSPVDDLPRASLRKLMLAMRYPGEEDELPKMLSNVKKTVENLESRIRIPKCQRTRFSSITDGYFVVYGSHHWLKATHTISFFTFLLRSSMNNSGGTVETIGTTPPVKKDTYYHETGKKYIKTLIKNGIDGIESNWEQYSKARDSQRVHNGGFVNFTGGSSYIDEIDDDDDDWNF